MTRDLEARIAHIEDRIAISELRARYCFLVDQGKGREAVDLFTEDGEFHGLASCRGREELLKFFGETIPKDLPAMWHLVHNEIIHIEGNSATGQCYFEMPSVLKGESYVCAGHYDDELIKQEGEWKFKSRKVTFYYLVPLKEGWAGERMRFGLK